MKNRQYNLFILSESSGKTYTCRFHPKLWLFLGMLFLCLAASFAYIWQATRGFEAMRRELEEKDDIILEQRVKFMSMAASISRLRQTVGTMREFDNKLDVMFHSLAEGNAVYSPSRGGMPERRAPLLFRSDRLVRDMSRTLDDLQREVRMEEVLQQDLILAIRDQEVELHLIPSIWPVRGKITSGFGYRRHPVTGGSDFHQGLDIDNETGAPVSASAAGRVVFADWDGAYGNCVHILHNSHIITRYGHLSKILVRLGQKVERGDVLGLVGSTGRTTGSHLHYEVRVNNKPVNPRNYILN